MKPVLLSTPGGYLFYIDNLGRRVWVGARPPNIDDPTPANRNEPL
jgi:hypothetical protein